MDLKRCINNHYYDSDKYSQCPHCASKDKEDNQKEKPIEDLPDIFEESKDINSDASGDHQEADDKKDREERGGQKQRDKNMGGETVGFFSEEVVVGWLAAIEGPHRGESFNLAEGMNYVGRSSDMAVYLAKDQGVSRNRHVTVIYDARNNEFVIHMGESRELVYVNDELLLEPRRLRKNDKISLGKTVLMFIPLCDENFVWK